jgi:hypothetical protein
MSEMSYEPQGSHQSSEASSQYQQAENTDANHNYQLGDPYQMGDQQSQYQAGDRENLYVYGDPGDSRPDGQAPYTREDERFIEAEMQHRPQDGDQQKSKQPSRHEPAGSRCKSCGHYPIQKNQEGYAVCPSCHSLNAGTD